MVKGSLPSEAHGLAVRSEDVSPAGRPVYTVIVFFLLQAFQQREAASPAAPRSGNPGYLTGKPLLVLTGDLSHSVSF